MKTIENADALLLQLKKWADDPGATPGVPGTTLAAPNYALALTALGEARGDDADGSSLEERVAVMCVIRNRVKSGRFGDGWGGVIFRPKQFSCWNPEDGNRTLLLNLYDALVTGSTDTVPGWLFTLWKETNALAILVVDGVIVDRTGGATHYYAPAAMKPPGTIPSAALGKPYKQIGSQRFYLPG